MQLPGEWGNVNNLRGRGWNMIALPFATEPESQLNYRLMINQYNETLKFSLVDKGVPNRGIEGSNPSIESDQFVVALDYEQTIAQIDAADFPESGKAGEENLTIHHEPGLLLHMTNNSTNDFDLARLATIPHGNSVLAMGKSQPASNGVVPINPENGLPIGGPPDIDHPYLSPYKHFQHNPFKGKVTDVEFQGFDPTMPHLLLEAANMGLEVNKTTVLEVDSTVETAGISNIPFVVAQAESSEMKSTFWIQELKDRDEDNKPKLRLQYMQVVMLDFFPRRDGEPGRIRWPHISINTMEKISNDVSKDVSMPMMT